MQTSSEVQNTVLYLCCTLDISSRYWRVEAGRYRNLFDDYNWLFMFPLFVAPDSNQSLVLPSSGTNEESETPFHHLPQVKLEQ